MLTKHPQDDNDWLNHVLGAEQNLVSAPSMIDCLGDQSSEPNAAGSLGQRILESRPAARVYAMLRGPVGRATCGGLSPADERRLICDGLRLADRRFVLDVGCGPGDFTRYISGQLPSDGAAVGVDVSQAMLKRAVGCGSPPFTVYVRADAHELPFASAVFDGVMSYAAVYMMREPYRALDELIRVLAPGGRLTVMTTCTAANPVMRLLQLILTAPWGVRMFTRWEVEEYLRDRNLGDISVHVRGMSQYISATK